MLYKDKETFLKLKKSIFFKFFLFVLIISISLFGAKILFSSDSLIIISHNISKGLFNTESKKLKGEEDNRINFLLLGIGGKEHDGGNLTDTIILASLQLEPLKLALISIPRDLLIYFDGYGYKKINSVHALAEVKEKGSGMEKVSQIIAQTFNIPIHYYLRVDFNGFEKFIDEIGGLDIYVERSFVDYLYPTKDHKYQTIRFEKGWQTMNGDQVLKFVRSRHGNNGESGDFARARRQQKVIQALKDKLLSSSTYLNPKKIYTLLDYYQSHFNTNLQTWEILKLIKIAKNLGNKDIIKFTFSDAYDNYLQASNYHGAYVLLPKSGDFIAMQNLIHNIFNQSLLENAKIEILNGTTINGLANKSKKLLQNYNLKVINIDNADKNNYTNTIIYNLHNDNESTITKLKELFPNAELKKELDNPNLYTDADILIILGKDVVNYINSTL